LILLSVGPTATGPDVVIGDDPEPPPPGVVCVVRSAAADRPIEAAAQLTMAVTLDDFEHPPGWPQRCVRAAAGGQGDAMTLLLAATARTAADA